MVAYGTVKFFYREGQYGFITVTDRDGNPTGEEVHFHYLNGKYPQYLGSELRLGSSTSDEYLSRLEFPHAGSRVVWESEMPVERRLIRWSYRQLWETMGTYGTLHPITWRIVQKRWESDEDNAWIQNPRILTGHVAETTVIKTRQCAPVDFVAFNGIMSPFLAAHEVTEEAGGRYSYELELRSDRYRPELNDGWWQFVRLMEPANSASYAGDGDDEDEDAFDELADREY